MAKSKIYISGKITGLPLQEAKDNFNNAKEYLKQKFFYMDVEILNPFELDHSKAEALLLKREDPNIPEHEKPSEHDIWAAYMEVDCGAVLVADGIYMLKNWEQSKGARVEYAVAKELGLSIEYER